MTDRIVRSVPVVIVCASAWLLLQGDLDVVNVIWGVVLGVALAVVFPVDRTALRHRLHPWGLVRWIAFVLWSLVLSSWAVIKVILRPTPANLRAGVVRIQLRSDSPLTTTLVANAITLTPGTMTLTATVEPTVLHVHGIGLGDVEEFRESVYDLERRTLAAIEPRPADPAATVEQTGTWETGA